MASTSIQNANTAPELDQASPTRTCCVCGQSRFRLLHHWDPAHLRNVATIPVDFWVCECGIALLDPVPSAQQLPETGDWWSPHRKKIYRNVWFKHIRIRIQNSLFGNARSRLIRQTQKVMPAGRLLDIGCGTGSLLKEACKFYDCMGLEPSDRAADEAESAGFQVIHRPHTQPVFAVCVLVAGLSEVGMQTHVQLFCQLRTAHHDRLAHRER